MLEAHYNGEINIADYWAVGDTRTESITAIASGTTGETQDTQEVELIIIGINHDNKADGSGKAAITVQTKNTLVTTGVMYSSYSGPDYSLWSTCPRRTWCNNDFKSSLSNWIQNLIQTVSKITNRYAWETYSAYRGQTTTTDDVFLLSEFEVFGSHQYLKSTYGSLNSDGTQYDYMKTESNRIKSGGSSTWWIRTSMVESNLNSGIYLVTSSGSASVYPSNYSFGIAPAFCL
jgi:hypothetical protein